MFDQHEVQAINHAKQAGRLPQRNRRPTCRGAEFQPVFDNVATKAAPRITPANYFCTECAVEKSDDCSEPVTLNLPSKRTWAKRR